MAIVNLNKLSKFREDTKQIIDKVSIFLKDVENYLVKKKVIK